KCALTSIPFTSSRMKFWSVSNILFININKYTT
ncbi:hypothetical protein CPC197_1058B, partial [Chlamydia psittaci C1/97]